MIHQWMAGAVAMACLLGTAQATEGETGPFRLTTLSAVGTAFAAHKTGNVEITGTFTLPQGLNCSAVHVTTSRTRDPDRAIFAVLKSALQKKLAVTLRLSDEGVLDHPGRCWIVAAGLPNVVLGDDEAYPKVCANRPHLPVCQQP